VAELIDDRGAAARSDDFFRSPQFYAAEGVTHSLRISAGGRAATLPLIVREIPGSEAADAISPYGYPGATIRGDPQVPPAPDAIDWSQTGLVSIFVRERIGGEPCLAEARVRSTVLVHDPGRPRQVRDRLAEQIRHNERRGWSVDVIGGPDAPDADLDAFAAVYEQTMTRARAAPRYFFEPGYFRSILGFERSWLLLARSPAGVGAGAIAALSDGVLHYYLGGTADVALGESPFKNVVVAMLDVADELEAPLNLGGGVVAGDGLEEFKRGFANEELPFHTHEIVCDATEYERLAGLNPRPRSEDFFPAYRAP
jgi:hypothetical protein